MLADLAGWLAPPPRALFLAGWAVLALRAFLGFTFIFAGLQKLANPGFFEASNPASIQSQLAGAARRSPVHALVAPLVHVAVPLGVIIAVAELAVGIGTFLGLWTRLAAAGGMALSVMLFLTISFHSSPYYTGSDIVFVFAWTPLLIAGSGGVLSGDAVIEHTRRRRQGAEPAAVVPVSFALVRRVCGVYESGTCRARRGAPCEPAPCPFLAQHAPPAVRLGHGEMDRRTFAGKGMVTAATAFAGLAVAGTAAGLGRAAGGGGGGGQTAVLPSAPSTGGTRPDEGTTTTTTEPGTHPSEPVGTAIGPAHDVPVGGAASFTDPTSGDPSLVVQPEAGTFLAFDAVCPHAGCIVDYSPADMLFICPCHGSEFDGQTGAVEVGPATRGLGRIAVTEGSDGQLYIT